jgi:hypothetical protein
VLNSDRKISLVFHEAIDMRDKSRTPGKIHGMKLENNQGILAKAK